MRRFDLIGPENPVMWKWAISVIPPLLALVPGPCPAQAQALSGIRVGDDLTSLDGKLGGPASKRQSTGPFTIQKWIKPDRNDLSITAFTKTRTVAYIETDWGNSPSGTHSDFGGFRYGGTSLDDIRTALGNNGFAFRQNAMQPTGTGLAMFNCYGIRDGKALDVCFVTLIPKADAVAIVHKRRSVGASAHLVALILASDAYLGTIWGDAKSFDPAYQPIAWR